ncbi:MAG: hypothetical protein AAGF12_11465 [Myxococcota bacterium]
MRILFLLLIGTLVACGDDSGSTSPDATAPDAGGDSGPTDNQVAYDDFYAETCAGNASCGDNQVLTACVCPRRPLESAETNRVGCAELPMDGDIPRTPEDDFCDPTGSNGAPNLNCMMPGMYTTTGTSQTVTLYGVVDVFGNGGNADNILVEVYREGTDGALGELLGMATATVASPCSEEEAEIEDDMVIGTRQLGFYSIANIPTETPLIVKTSGDLDFWRDLYSYNIQMLNSEVESEAPAPGACADIPTGIRAEYRARVLSKSDYNSIPLTAGLPSGIPNGAGAVAGEVHDCDDIRLELAQVAVNPLGRQLTYFNENPSNPLPDTSRASQGTSILGLYSALDLEPGPTDVAAVGYVGAQSVSLGWYRIQVFPNSVSAVTLRGIRSQQAPQ